MPENGFSQAVKECQAIHVKSDVDVVYIKQAGAIISLPSPLVLDLICALELARKGEL